jgi:Rieske Fe-S protein
MSNWVTRRRTLLAVAAGSIVAAGAGLAAALGRFFIPDVLYESDRRFSVGRTDQFPKGTGTLLAERRLFVFHAEDGFYVVSAVCTHLGCNVVHEEKKGFACPCHGSLFGEDGVVVRGPAPSPLPRFAVTLSRQGELVVDSRRRVGVDYRLRV